MNSTEKGEIGEDVVRKISQEVFLRYWCYPNPKDYLNTNKEICDLLILFKDIAIIISVKNYSFSGNYLRYFNNTLKKAISQIQGAERKLFKGPEEIQITHPDLGKTLIKKEAYRKIHRIIVNLNTEPLFHPGGLLTKNKNFSHVFNLESFYQILDELNTIRDFIEYLEKRERVFRNSAFIMLLGEEEEWDESIGTSFKEYLNQLYNDYESFTLVSGSELDLLSNYLLTDKQFSKQLSNSKGQGSLINLQGNWAKYIKLKKVQNKTEANKVSYFIDGFVKNEVLYTTAANNILIATELLSLDRFNRRIIGKAFFDFHKKYNHETGYFVARRYCKIGETVIALVFHGKEMSLEHSMLSMQLAAEGYALWDNFQSKKIIIICCSNDLTGFKFGFLPLDEPFSEEKTKQIKHDLKVFGWFENYDTIVETYDEFPE